MDVTDSVAASRQRVVGFADVVRIPLRRWRLVAAAVGTTTLCVLSYLLLLPATYTATSVVVLRPVVTDPFTLPSSGADRAINMTAENGIALGNDVIDSTARILQRDPDAVREALTTEVPTGGQVLRFQYADDAESSAVTGANTAAETYLRVREEIYKQQRAALMLSYDNTIKSVTSQRQAAQKGLPSGTSSVESMSPRTQAMLNQVGALNDQIAQLANARAKVASADLSPGSVTAAARAPVPSSHDAAPLFLAAALLGGLLLGMIAAHARETLDRRIRSGDQASDLIGLPALGSVRAAGRHHGEAAAADARYVSLALLKWIDGNPDRPLVVVSGRDDEGRTTVTANLAVALAEAGRDVTLAASSGSQEEIKKILFSAQKRTPPRPRTVTPSSPAPTSFNAFGAKPAGSPGMGGPGPGMGGPGMGGPGAGGPGMGGPGMGGPGAGGPGMGGPGMGGPGAGGPGMGGPGMGGSGAGGPGMGGAGLGGPGMVGGPGMGGPHLGAGAMNGVGANGSGINGAGHNGFGGRSSAGPVSGGPGSYGRSPGQTGVMTSNDPAATMIIPTTSGMSQPPGVPATTPTGQQAAGHQAAGQQAAGHQAAGHQAAGHQAAGHQAAGHQAAGHQAAGHQAAGQQAAGHQAAGHQAAGHQAAGHQAAGHQAAGHQAAGRQAAGAYHRPVPGASVPGAAVSGMPTSGMPTSGMPTSGMPISGMPVSGAPGLEHRAPLVVLVGAGVVRLCTLGDEPPVGVVVVDAPPSDTDERGVRAAQAGVAVLVVARDRTRNTELTRLVDRLRSAGAQTVGFVLTGGSGA